MLIQKTSCSSTTSSLCSFSVSPCDLQWTLKLCHVPIWYKTHVLLCYSYHTALESLFLSLSSPCRGVPLSSPPALQDELWGDLADLEGVSSEGLSLEMPVSPFSAPSAIRCFSTTAQIWEKRSSRGKFESYAISFMTSKIINFSSMYWGLSKALLICISLNLIILYI